MRSQQNTSAIVRKGQTKSAPKPRVCMSAQSSKAARPERATQKAKPPSLLRAQTSTRRKAGAETKHILKPSARVSPQPSPRKRKGKATIVTEPMAILPSPPLNSGHQVREIQCANAGKGGVQPTLDDHSSIDAAHLIDELIEQWHRRQMWHRAEKSLTLQGKSMCRRLMAGDKGEAETLYKSAMNGQDHELAPIAHAAMMPLLAGRDLIETSRKQVEKRLTEIAKQLPTADFIEGVRGVSWLSLAGIVGEAGNLSKYGNVAKLWKRMGLAVINGGRQRKVTGDDALLHGYSPTRRSLMWTIGDCIVKAGGPYREIYDKRKAYEIAKAKEHGLTVCPAAKIPKKDADKYRSDGHIHNRAKRYMEKRLLRDLWRAWRDQILFETQTMDVSPNFTAAGHPKNDTQATFAGSQP